MAPDGVKQLVCSRHRQKHARLDGTGYEQAAEALLAGNGYEILPSSGDPVVSYRVSASRDGEQHVLSDLLLLARDGFREARELLERRLAELRDREILFLVESYLEEELALVRSVGGKEDRSSVRLLNPSISADDMGHNGSGGARITSYRVGQDEARFVSIFNETFAGLCAPTHVEEVTDWTRDPGFCPDGYLFAELDGETVGFIAVEARPEAAFGYLQEIGVTEEMRGRGVADALMRAALERAEANGIRRMGTGVIERNTRALRFFNRWGFKPLYKRCYLRRGHDLLQDQA
jgi:ribosomal protein S18 acetylase RimI-like enzyme